MNTRLPIHIDRREVFRIGVSGAFGALVSRWLSPLQALAGTSPRAKTCILLWLNGGPSHIDTFDPKPGRPTGGSFKAIKTKSPNILLCEHLPHLAEHADKLCVVRSMSSKEGNHQRAQYYVHTGYAPNPTVVHPSLGAWTSSRRGEASDELPAFVSIGGPSWGAGFLGVQNGPFVMQKAGALPADVKPAANVDAIRFERRREALAHVEASFANATGDPKVEGRRQVYSKAVHLMQSPDIRAFDISGESDATKDAYGDTDFGRGCLLARRLAESGVKFIEVVLDGWDTHQNNFERTKKLMTTLDPAFAALLKDLQERHMLASTLVACMGEFGRTPRINGTDGRDHFPQAWSAVLAGGGIRGGITHGVTDADGAKPVTKPTSVPDLIATMATLLGMDPGHTEMTPIGRPISLTDEGAPVKEIVT
jgi:hypothetical protein